MANFLNILTSKSHRFAMIMLIFTVLLTTGTLIWIGYNTYHASNVLNETISKSLKATELRGKMMFYDEALSMSALTGILTGEKKWEDRYNQYDALLGETINEAASLLTPKAAIDANKKIDAANNALILMERKAFTLAQAGNIAEAKKILFSTEYTSQKKILSDSMNQYKNALETQSTKNLTDQLQKNKYSFLLLFLDCLLLIAAWIVAQKKIAAWEIEIRSKTESELTYKTKMEEAKHFLQEATLISKMTDLLQTCQLLNETYPIIAKAMQELFPKLSGGICIYNPLSQDIETLGQWGDNSSLKKTFNKKDCWGLRKGHVYIVNENSEHIACNHFESPPVSGYLCLPLITIDGTIGIIELNTSPDGNITDHEQQIAIIASDALKLSLRSVMQREKLGEEATHDPLTKLLNRRSLDEALSLQIQRILSSQNKLCVALFDIDYFKKINDTYGHAVGDEVLKLAGQLFHSHLRKTDSAYRYGGEEFVIIMEADLNNALPKLQHFCKEFKNKRITFNGVTLPSITLSVGVAEAPTHGMTEADLIRIADKALYKAKSLGRDRIEIGESNAS